MNHDNAGPPPVGGSLLPALAPPLPGNRQDSPEVIREWLASASRSPGQAWREWAGQTITVLPLGRRYSAVRIPGALVAEDFDAAREALAVLDGPVIHDRLTVGGSYYALVPRGQEGTWPFRDEAPYLDDGVWLGVPDIAHVGFPGSFWLIPPRYQGDLCGIDLVSDFVLQATATTDEGER
ncbi:hypothetical protein [Streptomyces acidiscabies]|uniref:hypothetical protein n=1 Tax=Streptomyces acidiscabies TaxID=42234 RepID=UPI0009515E90|nr:hypothetical protein [Streptomyces acidiscabies]